MQKNPFSYIFTVTLIITLSVMTGCKRDVENKIWNPESFNDKPNPTITSIQPADETYSGVGILNITGTNFSTNPSENHIYFNAKEGTVISASETGLQVKTANILDMITPREDSVAVKLRVDGAILFAEYQGKYTYYIDFVNLALEYGGFDNYDNLSAIACDSAENLYLTSDRTVFKVEKDSVKKEFTTLLAVAAKSMKVGPQGYLYYVQNIAMFRIPPEGGSDPAWFVVFANPVNDLDFDSDGKIYAGGEDGQIYKVDIENKTSDIVASYDSMEVVSIRVYDNAVYCVNRYIGNNRPASVPYMGVWKNNISGGSLGPNELVVNWDEYTGNSGAEITSITFSSEGEMFIGADAGDALTIRDPGGTMEPFYSEILYPPTRKMNWGNDKYLYIIGANDKGEQRVVRIDMLERRGAPYYGR